MEALVHVDHSARHSAGKRTGDEGSKVRDLFLSQSLLEGSVLLVVLDVVTHDTCRVGSSRKKGPGRDRIDAQTVLATKLVRKIAGVALKRRLSRRHTATITMDDLGCGEISEAKNRAPLVHHGTQSVTKTGQRIGAHAERCQITLPTCFQQIKMHLGTVGQRVDKDVQRGVAKVFLESIGQTLNRKVAA